VTSWLILTVNVTGDERAAMTAKQSRTLCRAIATAVCVPSLSPRTVRVLSGSLRAAPSEENITQAQTVALPRPRSWRLTPLCTNSFLLDFGSGQGKAGGLAVVVRCGERSGAFPATLDLMHTEQHATRALLWERGAGVRAASRAGCSRDFVI